MRGLPPPVAAPEPEPAAVQLVRHKEAQIYAPTPAEQRATEAEAVLTAAFAAQLAPKRERFCQHYVATDNAAEAAREAGYSERSARQTGHDLLKRPDVQERVQALQEAQAQRARPAPRRRSAALAAWADFAREMELEG